MAFIAKALKAVCRWAGWFTGCLALFWIGAVSAETPHTQNNITVYRSYGYMQSGVWHIPLRVWVSEPPGRVRQLSARGGRKVLRKALGIDSLSDLQKQRYLSRMYGFIADSKSRRQVRVRFDNDPRDEWFELVTWDGRNTTDFNGLLEGTILLSAERAEELLSAQNSSFGWLRIQSESDDDYGAGRVQLIARHGHSVISDIDDTIKITNIPHGEKAVLNNVFFKGYRAAHCMAEMYRYFSLDTAFHYVSGSPWQLYAPLSAFLSSADKGFPAGSMHMKNVRTNPAESESYKDFWKLAGLQGSATVDQKNTQITRLLNRFPDRTFTLIGDSGEHDPEIFAAIKSKYPQQVVEIRIRDVVEAATHKPGRLQGMTVIRPDGSKCDSGP
jgi:phosphatidate phosphatase APP1